MKNIVELIVDIIVVLCILFVGYNPVDSTTVLDRIEEHDSNILVIKNEGFYLKPSIFSDITIYPNEFDVTYSPDIKPLYGRLSNFVDITINGKIHCIFPKDYPHIRKLHYWCHTRGVNLDDLIKDRVYLFMAVISTMYTEDEVYNDISTIEKPITQDLHRLTALLGLKTNGLSIDCASITMDTDSTHKVDKIYEQLMYRSNTEHMVRKDDEYKKYYHERIESDQDFPIIPIMF